MTDVVCLSPYSFTVMMCISVSGHSIPEEIGRRLILKLFIPEETYIFSLSLSFLFVQDTLNPLVVLDAELQLDKMKQPMARRTLLLHTNLPQEYFQLTIQRDVGVVCRNQTAYLRVGCLSNLANL